MSDPFSEERPAALTRLLDAAAGGADTDVSVPSGELGDIAIYIRELEMSAYIMAAALHRLRVELELETDDERSDR